ncbi:MAG: ComEA family DNA-binding protein [Pyrinomonadaceae bacterium]
MGSRIQFGELVIRSALIVMIGACMLACTSSETIKLSPTEVAESTAETVNINTASKEELMRIPFIGEKLAGEIIEHRTRFGPFRKKEHLLFLSGISDRRFREISHLIRVD